MKEQGRCTMCGKPAVNKSFCEKHQKIASRKTINRYKKKMALGLCKKCNEPRVNAQFCEKHRLEYNEYYKNYLKRKNQNADSNTR